MSNREATDILHAYHLSVDEVSRTSDDIRIPYPSGQHYTRQPASDEIGATQACGLNELKPHFRDIPCRVQSAVLAKLCHSLSVH